MTPEQEERVARALAETARHDPVPPMPADVAATLDGVLADLVTERSARGGTVAGEQHPTEARPGAGVDEVAARRRRRRRHPSWLTAAAALALIAAAGGAVGTDGFGTLSTSDSQTSSAGGSTTVRSPDPDAARDDAGSQEAAPESAAPESSAPESSAPDSSAQGAGTPRLRTSSLAADVQRAIADDEATVSGRPGARRKALTGPPTGTPCAAPSTGPGEQVLAVRLDGKPATLLLGVARSGSRSARVYSCDDVDSPVASATVPLR